MYIMIHNQTRNNNVFVRYSDTVWRHFHAGITYVTNCDSVKETGIRLIPFRNTMVTASLTAGHKSIDKNSLVRDCAVILNLVHTEIGHEVGRKLET
jgi:hypothetical protein